VSSVGSVAGLCLGMVLVLSGLLKLRDIDGFIVGVVEYDVLPVPLARIVGKALPVLEIALGLTIVPPATARVASVAVVVLMTCFCMAVGANLARGRSLACHCFGGKSDEMLGGGTLARLGLMFALGVMVFVGGEGSVLSDGGSTIVAALVLAGTVDVFLLLIPALPPAVGALMVRAGPAPTLRRCVSLRGQPIPVDSGTGAREANLAEGL